MKKALIVCLAMLCAAFSFAKKDATSQVRWCTFNIRLLNDGDRKIGCHWDDRKEHIVKFVKSTKIDVIGMQEVTHPQLEYLLENLPQYDYVGVGRTDGKTKGEYSPVFFRKDKYTCLDKGNFWLSENPDAVGVKGWDAAIERIVSWAKLRDNKTGKVFLAVNTHFDHIGVVARKESAKLIIRKIQEIVGNLPAVATGDFNVSECDEAYHTMTNDEFVMNDAFHVTENHHGTTHTWQNFCQTPRQHCGKIDFIFVTPNIRVKDTYIRLETPDYQLSDHNPHWADLEF